METSAKVKLGVSLAVATGLAFMTLNSQLNANSQACTTTKLPDECTWLDEDSFRVFSALADTFFPQYQESEITLDSIRDALDAVNPGIFNASGGSIDIIHKHREMLCRGAITANVDSVAAMALQMNASPADQTQLYGLFKALSTSVGCGLLTGNFVPFQYLSLPSREVAVRKLRDSIIPELRAAFQAVKRLCGSIYLGFRENGKDNMAWDHLGYTPQHTLNPPDNYYQIPEAPITKNLSDYKLKPNAIGVHPKVPPPAVVSRLLNEAVASNTNTAAANETITLDADVVVVGSGAGGGMLAAELAKAGYNVIVLEKAGYYTPQDDFCRWRELEAFGKTFEKGGLCTTKDGHITILAGACVGGGTTINWSASFRTPDSIVKEWDDSCGGGSCFRPGGEFEAALDATHDLMHVNSQFSYREKDCESVDSFTGQPSGVRCSCTNASSSCCQADPHNRFAINDNNRLLFNGGKSIGFDTQPIPRNVMNCVNCGSCCHGCSYNSKQSTVAAFLEPLGNHADYKNRIRIIPFCHVDTVIMRESNQGGDYNTVATGVKATIKHYDPSKLKEAALPKPISEQKIEVRARVVVSSAGALHTPAFLLRSGLKHPMIGQYLTLHPVVGCAGFFPNVEDTKLYSGVSMGVVVKPKNNEADRSLMTLTKPTEKELQFAIETPPAHLGILGLVMPWNSGLEWKAAMLNYRHLGVFLALPRDESQAGNCITIDSRGQPVISYTMTPKDTRQTLIALEAQCRTMRAAGSTFQLSLTENTPWCLNTDSDEVFEEYLRTTLNRGLISSSIPLFSAHQMSSCRMHTDKSKGAIRTTGETFECQNLYVADASVMPTSLGINPMLTIEAFAYMISKNVIQRLQENFFH